MTAVEFESQNTTGLITICKPKALNALSREVLLELDEKISQVEGARELRSVIITGSGEKAFVAGADIKEIQALNSEEEAFEFAGLGQKIFRRLEKLPLPVMAAVNGFALGGGLELALACDFILASSKAKFGLPECSLGLMPGFGGCVRLSRQVGPGQAMEMSLTAKIIGAKEALSMGLVNRLCEPEELMDQALELGVTMARQAPMALSSIKKTIQQTYGLPMDEAMAEEQKAFAKLLTTQDSQEGTLAFMEKRTPQFTGH